jgi:hypothetical protein
MLRLGRMIAEAGRSVNAAEQARPTINGSGYEVEGP